MLSSAPNKPVLQMFIDEITFAFTVVDFLIKILIKFAEQVSVSQHKLP